MLHVFECEQRGKGGEGYTHGFMHGPPQLFLSLLPCCTLHMSVSSLPEAEQRPAPARLHTRAAAVGQGLT